MFKKLSLKIAHHLAPDYFAEMEKRVQDAEFSVNRRIAEYVSQMDPFEPLMKEVHAIFGQDFEHPEDNLDDRSRLGMIMWAYSQNADPHFKFMIDWIMNTQGNAMLKAPARTNSERGEVLAWGKAQISNMVLFRKEIGRLSLLYEELLEKNKGQGNVDIGITIE